MTLVFVSIGENEVEYWNNEINVVGVIQPEVGSGKVHLQDYIYGSNGICPTLTARDYKDPRRILIYEQKRCE